MSDDAESCLSIANTEAVTGDRKGTGLRSLLWNFRHSSLEYSFGESRGRNYLFRTKQTKKYLKSQTAMADERAFLSIFPYNVNSGPLYHFCKNWKILIK